MEGLLVAGLHNLDDDGLPMQTNEFYSKVVLACKPAGAIFIAIDSAAVVQVSCCCSFGLRSANPSPDLWL